MREGGKVFDNKEVLVTGGLGFIGSNLCIELVKLGARVTIVDNMLPRQGGNLFNIRDIADRVTVNVSDVRNQLSMNHLVKGKDYIFHLAGQVNHVDSMKNPLQDLEIKLRGNPRPPRGPAPPQQGRQGHLRGYTGRVRVERQAARGRRPPTNPKGIYAVTNLTAEKMVLVYDDVYRIRGACLRITNTYGPRHQMAHDEYGVFNWFIRKALDDEEIPVFGDGRILRDFLYVEDLVDSMLKVAAADEAYGKVFNVGTGVPVSFFDLAEKIVAIAGTGRTKFTEFTQERKEVEPATIMPT
jgi:UDP-glucose 4-epimerase